MAVLAPKPWFPQPPGSIRPEAESAARGVRIPTGVPDFDHMTGGLPAGSVVLLVGEPGAGHQEFALTSAVHLMLHFDDPELHQFFLGSAKGPFLYPAGIVYLSLSRSREQILREFEATFDRSYYRVLTRHLTFHDLSPSYFTESVVPASWASVEGHLLTAPAPPDAPKEPLSAIADALERDGRANLVIVDSITDLLVRKGTEPSDLAALLKGLRRRAKAWNGLVYLWLTRGVVAPATEQALLDSVDGVLSFGWTSNPHHSQRQRQMLIERFMPVLSHVRHEHQGRFVIRVSSLNGLVTTQYERI